MNTSKVIEKKVRGGADSPPPGMNRVKLWIQTRFLYLLLKPDAIKKSIIDSLARLENNSLS